MTKINLIEEYRKLYAVFRNKPIKSNISSIRSADQYLHFKNFGVDLWNSINSMIANPELTVDKKKSNLVNDLRDIVDLNPVILDKFVVDGTLRLDEDEFYELILGSQPSIVVEFAASAAVKEIKAWRDIIQAKISTTRGFDPFSKNRDDNPLYETIVGMDPVGIDSFQYKVINFFAIKDNPIIFNEDSTPKFKTEARGQVDVSIMDFSGKTHQSAATATQLNQLGFESDQVFRHWGIEQIYSYQHQKQIDELSTLLNSGEYDKFLVRKAELLNGRSEWVGSRSENIKSKDGQRIFIKENLPLIIDKASYELGDMFFAPEVPRATSKAINALAFEIAKGISKDPKDIQNTAKRIYKALIAQVMEAQFGNLAYNDKTDHEEILSKVPERILINSKSMNEKNQLQTAEDVDMYITSVAYGRDVMGELMELNFINSERMQRGFGNYDVEDRPGKPGNSVRKLVTSLTSKRQNADINTIALLLLMQMGIDVTDLQEFTRDKNNKCRFDLDFSTNEIDHCAKASALGKSKKHVAMLEKNTDMLEKKTDMLENIDAAGNAMFTMIIENSEKLGNILGDINKCKSERKMIATHEYECDILGIGLGGDVIMDLINSYNISILALNDFNKRNETGSKNRKLKNSKDGDND